MMTIIDTFKAVYGFLAQIIKLIGDAIGKEVNLPDLSGLGDGLKDMLGVGGKTEEAAE